MSINEGFGGATHLWSVDNERPLKELCQITIGVCEHEWVSEGEASVKCFGILWRCWKAQYKCSPLTIPFTISSSDYEVIPWRRWKNNRFVPPCPIFFLSRFIVQLFNSAIPPWNNPVSVFVKTEPNGGKKKRGKYNSFVFHLQQVPVTDIHFWSLSTDPHITD